MLCQEQHCPLDGSTVAVAFNGVKLNRNGELHQDKWEPLLRDADKYTNLQCGVPLQQVQDNSSETDFGFWILLQAVRLANPKALLCGVNTGSLKPLSTRG
ncbi:hypothetical protein WJX82_004012 [Trebouxia sp. C0006]